MNYMMAIIRRIIMREVNTSLFSMQRGEYMEIRARPKGLIFMEKNKKE